MNEAATMEALRRARLYHHLQTAAHSVRRASDRSMMSGTGLTTAQVSVLSVLAETGPTSQRGIAAQLGVNEPAVTEMVARLLAAGCIAKDVDPTDARARVIALTDHGRSGLRQARPAFAAVNRGLADVLSTAEVEVLADLLDRIHHRFAPGEDR